MTYKTATIKVLSNFVNWKEAEEYDVDENTTTRELITTVLHRHGMLSRDPNLFYLTLENRGGGSDDPGLTLNLSDESLVMNYSSLHPSAHFAMHMRQGGLIKIHDESIMPGSYYKSLFISKRTTGREVISLLLASYGKTEPAENFALTEQNSKGKEVRQLKSSECPLLVDQSNQQTTIHLKRIRQASPEKSTLTRSQTIASAQDLKRKTGISREATVVRLRESFRRLQRLRTDQEALEAEVPTMPSSARLASKFALSEEALDGPSSARKAGALGKIGKKLSSLTNIRSAGRSDRISSLHQDPLHRSSARSYGSLLPSTTDPSSSSTATAATSNSSPRSSKRYSFPPASFATDPSSSDLSSSPTTKPSASSPRTPRRGTVPSASSPRSPRRQAPQKPSNVSPDQVAVMAAASSEAALAAATAAAVSHALSSPRAQRRYRSFHGGGGGGGGGGGYPQSAREPRSSAFTEAGGSMSARGTTREEWVTRPGRLPVRSTGEVGGGSGGGRRQLPQAPADDVEARRRLLALEAQRRLRMMAGANRTQSSHQLASSPSRIQAKTRPNPLPPSDLHLRGLSDDSDTEAPNDSTGRQASGSPRKDSSLETVIEVPPSSARRRVSPRRHKVDLALFRRSEAGVQTEAEAGSAAKTRQIAGHPSLFALVSQCDLFSVRLDRDSLWAQFGLHCFEAIFPQHRQETTGGGGAGAGGDVDGLVGPTGRKPLLGRAPGAFQAVNAQALASIQSLIAVDSLDPGSPAGSSSISSAASTPFSLAEGDFLLEVNGISVLSATPQHVESLLNSFKSVEITAARPRTRQRRAETSADSTDGSQEESANSDLERQLVSLRLKYAQLKAESRRNEQLISELRDVVARKVRIRVGGANRPAATDATFKAIRSGYAEEVVSTV